MRIPPLVLALAAILLVLIVPPALFLVDVSLHETPQGMFIQGTLIDISDRWATRQELIRELRHEFPDVKVITMSGGGLNGTMDMLPVARHLGAVGVLYKPFDQAAVLAAIRKVVEPPPAAYPRRPCDSQPANTSISLAY